MPRPSRRRLMPVVLPDREESVAVRHAAAKGIHQRRVARRESDNIFFRVVALLLW